MKYHRIILCYITIGNVILTKFSALNGIIYLILLLIAKTPFLAFQELLKVLSFVRLQLATPIQTTLENSHDVLWLLLKVFMRQNI